MNKLSVFRARRGASRKRNERLAKIRLEVGELRGDQHSKDVETRRKSSLQRWRYP
jgi:hypothetical protein